MIKYGIMLSEISFSNIPVIFKNCGLEFFIIDYEHGCFDYSDMSKIIMTAKLIGLKVVVRLPGNQRKDIIKLMDMGADGLLLPMTHCADDIKEVVKYGKYQPIGQRGISTTRAHTFYNPPPICEYIKKANEETYMFAQIETVKGVKNLESILNENGVDGVFVGPNDLLADYGCLGPQNTLLINEVIKKVGQKCKEKSKLCGIITNNQNYLSHAKENDFTLFCVGSELNAIKDYCKRIANLF